MNKILFVLSFFTRLPVGRRDFGGLTLADGAWAFPVVGAIIGLIEGIFFILMLKTGLASIICAWLTLGFHLLLTGGLHEDGLADTADGLASGRSVEQKLAIMRDSRIGSYGVLALIVALSLKANIIASLDDTPQTILAFIAAAAASRGILPLFMLTVPPANISSSSPPLHSTPLHFPPPLRGLTSLHFPPPLRGRVREGGISAEKEIFTKNVGLAAAAGIPSKQGTIAAILLSLVISVPATGLFVVVPAIFASITLYFTLKYIIIKNFGGITGDILGAAQQASELLILLIAAMVPLV